jgi:hypothetical protein
MVARGAMTDDPTNLRQALRARGFSPLPIGGKRPPMEKWQEINANPEEIALWPKLYPFSASTGVHTKRTPAIDIDITNPEAAEAIETLARSRFEEHGALMVRVGKWPKRAIMFRANTPFAKLTLKVTSPHGVGEKIEVLADGQQIVVHGVHVETKKPYAWTGGTPWADVRAEDLPHLNEAIAREFLRDAGELLVAEHGYKHATEPKAKANRANSDDEPHETSDWGALFTDIYTGADLHDATTRLAASFIAAGMSPRATIERLRSLLTASQAPKDARWRERYNDIPRAVRTAEEKFGAPQGEPQQTVSIHWHGKIDPRDTRSWMVQNLIPEVGSGLISGQWASYKTFLAVELSCCVMTPRPFLGFDIVRPGGVLFLALEGASEVPIRLQGALDHKGDLRLQCAPFAWVETCPPLTDPKTAEALIKLAKQVEAHIREQFHLPLSLIVGRQHLSDRMS